MDLVKCPNCHREMDIDSKEVEKKEDGVEVSVKCPVCGRRSVMVGVGVYAGRHVRHGWS